MKQSKSAYAFHLKESSLKREVINGNKHKTHYGRMVDDMKRFDLPVMNDGRKSFYGKAIVIEHDNGDVELQSYTTIVCRIRNGKFERLWNDYSATTMRHINSFIAFYGIEGGGKSWWNSLECVGKQSNGNLTPTESLQIMYARRKAV